MSDAQKLGFESPYVLMKIGHDLADGLDVTAEPASPDLEAQAAKIPDSEGGRDILLLSSDEYEDLGEKPLT